MPDGDSEGGPLDAGQPSPPQLRVEFPEVLAVVAQQVEGSTQDHAPRPRGLKRKTIFVVPEDQ